MLEYLHLGDWRGDGLLSIADHYFSSTIIPQRLKYLQGSQSPQVVAGKYHSFRLSADGSLYARGRNAQCQLGLGHNRSKSHYCLVPFPEPVRQVAIGFEHSLLLTVSGAVYACGSNISGQLGLKNHRSHAQFTLVPLAELVVEILAAGDQSHLLTVTGSVYACGNNYNGQLGLGDKLHRSQFTLVVTPTPEPVLSLTVGDYHSCFLTVAGSMYACGSNCYGQLELGDTRLRSIYSLVPTPEPVKAVVIGGDFSFLLAVYGSTYACGNNDYSRLGFSYKSPLLSCFLVSSTPII